MIEFQADKQEIGLVNNSNSELSYALLEYLESKHNLMEIEDDEDHIS